MAQSLLSAAHHKATNDLALWIYICRDAEPSFKESAAFLGFIAIITNLPCTRVRKSFAYNAANYYIGDRYLSLAHCILAD